MRRKREVQCEITLPANVYCTMTSVGVDDTHLNMHLPVGRGQVSVAFVCPSVLPFVAYVPNNSRTRRPSVPKFRMKVPHFWCDSHTSFKVKRWKIKVTTPVNADHWLSCDADTSAAYLPTATYRITLVGVFHGHFCINLRQTRTQNSIEGPLHWKRFSKSRILSP